MQRSSPTLAGFRTVFARPSFGFAEIAWRWSFGFAAALLLMLSLIEYLDSLPVTYRDELMFRTRQPALISRALSQILRGSSLRVLMVAVLLVIALSAAWILLSSLGRAATVKALLDHFRTSGPDISAAEPPVSFRMSSLAGLNFLRVSATLAALVGCVAAVLLGQASSPSNDPSPGSAMLVGLFVVMLVGLAWSIVNWFLSLASIFVVADGQDTFDAIGAAVALCRLRLGAVLAANTWFGLAHGVALVLATSVVSFPLIFVGVLPGAVIFGGILSVALLYFAVVDFLYVGRLGAYIAILEEPDVVPTFEIAEPSPGDWGSGLAQNAAGIDRSESILSDLPNLIPES